MTAGGTAAGDMGEVLAGAFRDAMVADGRGIAAPTAE